MIVYLEEFINDETPGRPFLANTDMIHSVHQIKDDERRTPYCGIYTADSPPPSARWFVKGTLKEVWERMRAI